MKIPFSIYPMSLDQLPQVYEIELAAHQHPWSLKLFSSNFGHRYFNHVICIDDNAHPQTTSPDKSCIGFYVACQAGPEVTLMNLAIHPDYQGAGLGNQLMAHLKEQALARQAEEIWLEVRASNQAAIALYHKQDFAEIDLRKGYYPAEEGKEDAIIMCCYLNPPA